MRQLIYTVTTSIFLLLAASSTAATLTGKVIHVADGDTITVLDDSRTQHVIRLSGIDSPEKRQPFGTKAKQHLSGLVAGQTVTVDYKKRDRYKRIVGKITLNGTDICLEQIRAGLAWHYKKYVKEQPDADRMTYAAEEDAARERKAGLWSEPHPVAPWEFRKTPRQ